MDLNPTDASLLAAVLRHPRRGIVVCRAIYDRDGEVVDFAVQRANEAARALLGAGIVPGGRLGELGGRVVPQLAELVGQGGYGKLELPRPALVQEAAPSNVDVCAVGDRVVLILGEESGRDDNPERWFRGLVESTADVIQVVNRDGTTRYITPGAADILGYPPENLIGTQLRDMVDPGDVTAVDQALKEVIDAPVGAVVEGEFRVRHGKGDVRWIYVRAMNHLSTAGVEGIVSTWRDVTVPKATDGRLRYAATRDHLTGLPNRTVFADHLELALAGAARRPGKRVAVLFCDLDQFKVINDSLGHPAGDGLLRQVARRLRDAVRPADTVARFGGDEFAILCVDVDGEVDAVHLAQRALREITGLYRLSGASHDVLVSASIGVALSGEEPLPEEDEETLLQHADNALYEAKRLGRGRVQLFSHPLEQAVSARLRLEAELREAVETQQFVLHYQPKLDLRSGRLVDAEALLRWAHPTRGLLRPDAFLPLAEKSGLIVTIGRWVLREAARQAAVWERRDHHIVVDVNLSAQEVTGGGLVEDLGAAIRSADIDPSMLNLEITEQAALSNLDATLAALTGARRLGTHLTLDDFGTGYSSLTCLQELPVDTVKLDQSFTMRLLEHRPTRKVIAAVIDLSHALGQVIIAEGVERADQLRALEALGCDQAQGYLIGRPVPPEHFPLVS